MDFSMTKVALRMNPLLGLNCSKRVFQTLLKIHHIDWADSRDPLVQSSDAAFTVVQYVTAFPLEAFVDNLLFYKKVLFLFWDVVYIAAGKII